MKKLFLLLAVVALAAAGCEPEDAPNNNDNNTEQPDGGDQGGTEDGGDQGGAEDGGDQGGTEDGGDQGGAEDGGDQGGTEDGGDQGGAEDGGDQGGAEDGGDQGGTEDGGDQGGAEDGGDQGGAEDGGDQGGDDMAGYDVTFTATYFAGEAENNSYYIILSDTPVTKNVLNPFDVPNNSTSYLIKLCTTRAGLNSAPAGTYKCNTEDSPLSGTFHGPFSYYLNWGNGTPNTNGRLSFEDGTVTVTENKVVIDGVFSVYENGTERRVKHYATYEGDLTLDYNHE